MLSAPCEPGALATDVEDGNLTNAIVTCPPNSCLPVGCPRHAYIKKGIQGCGIDALTAEPGTEYELSFQVWDRSVPPKSATVTRNIRVISPCDEQETYCPGYGVYIYFVLSLDTAGLPHRYGYPHEQGASLGTYEASIILREPY